MRHLWTERGQQSGRCCIAYVSLILLRAHCHRGQNTVDVDKATCDEIVTAPHPTRRSRVVIPDALVPWLGGKPHGRSSWPGVASVPRSFVDAGRMKAAVQPAGLNVCLSAPANFSTPIRYNDNIPATINP